MTNSIEEIGGAKTILAVGTNTTSAHPIIALKVKDAVKNGGAKLIVINPKEIELCRHAHLFLQNKPGTDIHLLMGMAAVIVNEGLQDSAFIEERCEDYEAFKDSLKEYSLERVAEISGVSQDKIVEAARIYATQSPASILYCMGITQHVHGTHNVWAVSNIALLTGNLGKTSAGVNPLRGQNNVQGACDMGALPDVYPGYQKVEKPESKEKFEAAWDCELNDSEGLTHTEIFDALHKGTIKSLYLIGENPVLSEANAGHAIEAMKRTEFMVVQDIFMSETAELADVVLPATTFAEKDGTFTNTERRIQRVRKAIDPVGDSKPDWWITTELAKRLGGKGFDYKEPSEIMDELTKLIPAYGGISYKRLERGGIQWPCLDEDHPGTKFLHGEKFSTVSGKGKFIVLPHPKSAEVTTEEYPLILTTDRSLFHFHGTMTRRVYGLNVLGKSEQLVIHPDDAVKFGVKEGELVRVVSRRGAVEVQPTISRNCKAGLVSMSFHFSETPTNMLTSGEVDPIAKIPTTKICAVRLEKITD